MKKILSLFWILGILALLYLAIFHQYMWLLLIAIPLLASFIKAIIPNEYSIEAGVIIPTLLASAAGICLVLALMKWSSTFLIIGIGCGIAGFVPAFFKEVFTAPTYTKDEIMKMQPEKKDKNDKDASVVGRAVVGGVIAGGAGAVVGALSAVDENNRKHSDSADAKAGEDKDASVVGRAVVGGIIAGPAGAVVGAASAVDKNNRKRSEKDKH